MVSISIIIPVYNVEQYICRCIQSIMNQEECGVQLECIIVDDSSPDNSIQIVNSCLNGYNGNIVFLIEQHPHNMGVSAARNTGIKLAKGDYLFFIDPDDWLPSDALVKFVNYLRIYPDVDMIVGNHFDAKENRSYSNNISKPTLFNSKQLRYLLLNDSDVNCSCCNKLIRSLYFKQNMFPIGVIFEDIYWAYFMFNDIRKTVIFPDVTYYYENNHPGSITNTADNRDKISLQLKSITYIFNAILDSPYPDLYPDSILGYLSFYINALRLQKRNDIKDDEFTGIERLRKRFVTQTFKDGRWLLSLYIILLSYPPTSHVFDFSFVRHHYHIIDRLARRICNFCEKFNHIPQRLLKKE